MIFFHKKESTTINKQKQLENKNSKKNTDVRTRHYIFELKNEGVIFAIFLGR